MNAIFNSLAHVSKATLPWLIAAVLLATAVFTLALAAWLGFVWALAILCLLLLSGCVLGPMASTCLPDRDGFQNEPENRFKTAMKGAALGFLGLGSPHG